MIPTPGLVQHRIVWRLLPSGGVLFARRATRILNTLGCVICDLFHKNISEKMKKKDLGNVSAKCGKCDKISSQRVVSTYTHTVRQEFDDEEGLCIDQDYILRLSHCYSCEGINLTFEDEDGEVRILWPTLNKELEGLPSRIAKAYKASRAVRLIDANAFAVLLGRVLELVCIDRNAEGDTLYAKLQDLGKRGEVPDRLIQMAHQVRTLRNIGAHATLGELTQSEVPIVDDLIRAILEYVYTAPAKINQVEQRIQKLQSRKR